LSKTEIRVGTHDTDVNCARNVQTRAFASEEGEVERRQRRGASGAPIVEKCTERGQGALLGLVRTSRRRFQKTAGC